MNPPGKRDASFLFVFLVSCFSATASLVMSPPMSCNASSIQPCPAALYYVPDTTKTTLGETASLFRVNANVVNRTIDGFLVLVGCTCQHDHYAWRVDYAVQEGDTWGSVSSKFGSFLLVDTPGSSGLVASRTVTLELLCGCSSNSEIVSYNVRKGDTLFDVCMRFGADLSETVKLNELDDPNRISVGDIIFVPVKASSLQSLTLFDISDKDTRTTGSAKSKVPVVIGAVAAAITAVILTIILVFWMYHKRKKATRPTNVECPLRNPKMPFPRQGKGDSFTASNEARVVSTCNSDKATVFAYSEICEATCNLSLARKIGQGSFGSVYLGQLRGMDVAVKQMTSTKSKEFLSELNILCKVHHVNLIELIGYAAGGDSLFLVYEYAQNGALSDHLHRPSSKGHKPLPWTAHVQIALDAAKGLEYIHKHTKPYYVHRDVKTSNILLDSSFRAKIADFGLVKLLEHSPEVGGAASRIVGTFGYLAPEYARDGIATTKNDVYAFGVVLMELITGQPALTKDGSSGDYQYGEHRSLIQHVLSALDDPENTQLRNIADSTLSEYYKDSMLQMALLSRDCVIDDWNRRPDMSRVVVQLSDIMSCSKEWEDRRPKH